MKRTQPESLTSFHFPAPVKQVSRSKQNENLIKKLLAANADVNAADQVSGPKSRMVSVPWFFRFRKAQLAMQSHGPYWHM